MYLIITKLDHINICPLEAKYVNTAVVNFVLREYDYGGYVMAEANQGFSNNNYGDYDIAGKLKKGHMTYQATIGGYYKSTHENHGNTDVTYKYNDAHEMNKKTDYNGTNKQEIYSTNFSARYDSKKTVWLIKTGLRFNKVPNSRTTENVSYNDEAAGTSILDESSQSLSPYINSQIIIYGLPHKSYLVGSLSFSYNHNKGNNKYLLMATEQQSIFNKTRENSYLPSLTLSYYLPISKKSSLVCKTDFNTEIYRTNYYGTADTYQKLMNSYYSFDLKYSYRFSNNWKGNVAVKMPIQSYKVQDNPVMSKVYVNGSMTLNGKISQRHSIYIEANIKQVQFTKGNLFMKLQVNSLLVKNGYIKSWLTSENINNYTYTSRPWDRRYVSLSASYTIDYGKKISHGSSLNFGGKTKTSVL